jgi:membrane-bound lytic murein transglycosylase D
MEFTGSASQSAFFEGMELRISNWRVRLGLLVCAIGAASGCAHAPPADRTFKGPAEEPVGLTPPAETSGTYPVPIIPPAAQNPAPAPELEPAAQVTEAQKEDLFDRIRSGFKLDDVERSAVVQQLNWYAGNPEYLERAFGRAELYLYHIVTELEARGMPLELALLPVVESAFEPYAYSRARASGLWQFIPGTGSRFGLKQNWWYDGRRDVVESTRAALDYLQYMHDEFNGDWLLAIAGYNCGENGVARAIKRNRAAGRPTDFWSLSLPKETRAYVPKLLAMKRLVANPEDFGLGFSAIPNQPYFDRVETLGQIDLKMAAEVAGVTYEELYELNPAFHRWATDPAGPHFLLLPVDGAQVFRQNIGQLTPEQRLGAALYIVKPGDSVSSVAQEFSTTTSVIRELNSLPSGTLTVGSTLLVPAAVTALPPKVLLAAARVDSPDRRSARRPHLHVVKRGDSLWRIAQRNGMSVTTLAKMNGMRTGDTLRAGQRLRLSSSGGGSSASSATPASGRKVTYTVRSGDTLSRIARLFQVTVAQIVNWNDISSRSMIRPGQKLTIKVAGRRG